MTESLVELFARAHPKDVAAVLKLHETTEVVNFLNELPPKFSARIVACLESTRLKSCLIAMSAPQIGALLVQADHEEFVTITSHLDNNRYHEIINAAGDHQALLAEKLHAFSEETLGPVANPSFISVRKGRLTIDVIADLRNGDYLENCPVFLQSDTHEVLGVIPPLALLSAKNESLPIEQLMEAVDPLTENMSIREALAARQWSNHVVLPVVNLNNRLIGSVSRSQLLRLTQDQASSVYGIENLVSDVVSQYVATCADLLEYLLGRQR